MHGFPIDQSIIITFPLFIDSSTKYRLENQSLMVGIGVIIGSLGSIISMRRFLKF